MNVWPVIHPERAAGSPSLLLPLRQAVGMFHAED
jgi:hypothetical protein